jgi:hypothetical protein
MGEGCAVIVRLDVMVGGLRQMSRGTRSCDGGWEAIVMVWGGSNGV